MRSITTKAWNELHKDPMVNNIIEVTNIYFAHFKYKDKYYLME